MKHEHLVTAATAFLLASLLSVGSMGAMITGLELPVEHLHQLHTAWTIAAAAGCILFSLQKSWLPALLPVLGVSYLWEYHDLSLPIQALISRLSWLYGSAYGWGMVEFAGLNWRETTLDLPLAAWGCCVALTVTASVAAGRSTIPALILALLPVGSTLVVTNTVPAAPYLFAVILAVILLILPATVRQHSPHQGAKLTLLTALPVILALGGLFAAFPKDTYVNQSREQLNQVVSWFQSGIHFSSDRTGLIDQTPATPNATATANLSRVGPRNQWGYTVLEAEADFSGTVYIRGQDFDRYDGTAWTATQERAEHFGGLPDYGTWIYDGEITIRTDSPGNVLYLPYYPTQEQTLDGGRKENTEDLREYSFGIRHPQNLDLVMFDRPVGPGVDTRRWTELPASTRRWAVDYVNNTIAPSGSIPERANAIAGHVRRLVPYDTNTPRMSGSYTDFAQWFLEEADRGYCVHFASATAVLLRAAGIPARYVTGYMFEAVAGETVEVTANRAHAWVEYYHESTGAWVVLESTPADLRQEQTDPPATEPEETEPPTRPTMPQEEEDAATRPIDPARPTAPQNPKLDLTPLWTALRWAAGIAAAWVAVQVQYRIRRSLRRKGSPNIRALHKWRDIEILCRLTKQTPPEELLALARKAKFSQYTLTAEELHTFDAWLTAQRMKHRAWYWNIVCKYVLAI